MNQKQQSIKSGAWSDEERLQAIELFKTGKTYGQIATALNRDLRSIGAIVSEGRRVIWDNHEELKRMWAEGMTAREIGELTGKTGANIFAYFKKFREDFPRKTEESTKSLFKARIELTPENTEIQYEFVEHPMPDNALMTPFYCLEVGQCSWVSGGFWDKVSYDTPCCGLPVVDRRGKGLVKSFCRFHYEVSIVKE